MTTRARSRILDRAMIVVAGVLSLALITTVGMGIGPPWSATTPPACRSMAISVAEGAVGEPTIEAAVTRWLNESASPLTPRSGWIRSGGTGGLVYLSHGGRRIEVFDLTGAKGSGWLVTAAYCY